MLYDDLQVMLQRPAGHHHHHTELQETIFHFRTAAAAAQLQEGFCLEAHQKERCVLFLAVC